MTPETLLVMVAEPGKPERGPVPLADAIPADDPEREAVIAECLALFEAGQTVVTLGGEAAPVLTLARVD